MLPKSISPRRRLPALLTFCWSHSDPDCKPFPRASRSFLRGSWWGWWPVPAALPVPTQLCPTVSARWKGVAAPSLLRFRIRLAQAAAVGFHSLPGSLLPHKCYGTVKHFAGICLG